MMTMTLPIPPDLVSDKWDKRFMRLATEAASWVKGKRRGVGCCLVSPDRNRFSLGYSGYARGIEDTEIRLADTEYKRRHNIHAELNAILNAKCDLTGWSAFVSMAPCSSCAGAIIQAGIRRVVCPPPHCASSYWVDSCTAAVRQLKEAGVEYTVFME